MTDRLQDTSEIGSAGDALARIGQVLGTSEWFPVTQELVNAFARTTGDEQWIHVDPERARSGLFGACIAHGQLTFALAGGKFFHEIVRTSAKVGVNYGCDRLRYPSPVRVGTRIRGRAEMLAGESITGGGVQLIVRMTVEIEGESRPGCVADILARYYF